MCADRLDRFGDELPRDAIARYGTSRWRHGGPGAMPCWSHDGRLLATALTTRVEVWDGRTGSHLRTLALPPHSPGSGTLTGASFLPDGTFVTLARGRVTWWNPLTGALLRVIDGAINHGAVSPDGSLVVALDHRGSAQRWDLRDGRELTPLRGPELDAWSLVEFSPHSRSLLVARYDGSLFGRCDARSGTFETVLARDTPNPTQIAFSRDGSEALIALADGPIRRFSLRDGRELRPLDAPFVSRTNASLVAMSDGSWICCRSGSLVRRHPDEPAPRWRRDDLVWGLSIAVSPDERVVAVGGAGAVTRFDAVTGDRFEDHGHTGYVDGFRATSDRALASYASTWPPELFRWRDDGADPEVISRKIGVAPRSLSPDGARVAVVDREETLRVVSVDRAHSSDAVVTVGGVTGAWMIPGDRVCFTRLNGFFVIDLATGRELRLSETWEWWLGASADGSLIASHGRRFVVRRASDGAEVMSAKPPPALAAGAFTEDGATLVTLSHDDGLRSWDVATGAPRAKLIRVLPKPPTGRRLMCFAMSRDGSFALVGDHRGELFCVDLDARRSVSLGLAHRGEVRCVEVDDERGVARTSGSDTVILTWDLSALRARVTPRKRKSAKG